MVPTAKYEISLEHVLKQTTVVFVKKRMDLFTLLRHLLNFDLFVKLIPSQILTSKRQITPEVRRVKRESGIYPTETFTILEFQLRQVSCKLYGCG